MTNLIQSRLIRLLTYSLWALSGFSAIADADEAGRQILNKNCTACHSLEPATATTLDQYWNRKAPDLSSAGLKYKQQWLINWLQQPNTIRPAGMFYGNHIQKGKTSDRINTESLYQHPNLSSQDAQSVTDTLMTFKHNQELINQNAYKPGSISKALGEMMFDKFKGCLACHQIEPGYGGLSGPEVYTAAERLQEDYLISFMRDPQAWEPKSIMPNKHLKETDLQKMVHYLTVLSKEKFQ